MVNNEYHSDIKKAIAHEMNEKICERGFCITNFPMLQNKILYIQNWEKIQFENWHFYLHPNQRLYTKRYNDCLYFIIGHAYNPFSSIIDEYKILDELCCAENNSKSQALDYINSLTGVFLLGKIEDDKIIVLLDCAGMMSGYYGVIGNNIIITSHTVIAGTAFELEVSEYVKSLLKYKFYSLYGGFLPGDITPYDTLKRILPNTAVSISNKSFSYRIMRFYPCCHLKMATTENEYMLTVQKIAHIMKKSMLLIKEKWKHPAISLTGGMDSKTTLAAAKNIYDSFSFFSYVSSKAEKIDADAAHKICLSLDLPHKIYDISSNPQDYSNFNEVQKTLQYNKDYIGKNNTNDICKRIFFDGISDFDIEVKSWVSEIGRANYYKKFGKRKMPKKITPRRCSSLYKIFLHNRTLLKQTDNIFADYIEKTDLSNHLYNFDWSDIFLWEIRYGGWGGLVITAEHKYSFDITIPYNNRKLLELMLSVPLEKRRKDVLHADLIKYMNKKISDTGITVINMNETKFREFCEKCYFNINSNLPF